MRHVVRDDGVVTIVFGHGEPEVWQRLLRSIERAGLVMTGSWPANTESGGQQGKANIETTLTMACRPAPADRPVRPQGRRRGRDQSRDQDCATPTGNAGDSRPQTCLWPPPAPPWRSSVATARSLTPAANPVDIHTFLPLARAAVQDAMAVEIDHQPLESFDARTRFALWWVRLYGRQAQAKSELRWQTLASCLDLAQVRDLVRDASSGVQFVSAADIPSQSTPNRRRST